MEYYSLQIMKNILGILLMIRCKVMGLFIRKMEKLLMDIGITNKNWLNKCEKILLNLYVYR